MKWLRKLFGLRTAAEDYQAGRTYVDGVVAAHRADKAKMNNLWYECDPNGVDYKQFDKGMRDRLRELNVPHPMDIPE